MYQDNPVGFLLQIFKRHYRKAKDIYASLVSKNGSFSYQYSYNQKDGLQTKIETPNEEETIRFNVLMRRFLNPSDKIYYPNVWNTLKTSFPEATSFNRMEQIEKFIEALNRGTVAINVNQKDITAENVYHILANGEYFGKSDDEAVVFLQNLADLPMGQFLLFQFYNYNLGFFQVASMMFDILLEVEKDEQYSNFFQGTATTDKRCIYCLEDTGTFTSEEHIVPESLGNYDTFLPKGYVCDKCNNETLSGLDAALVNSDLLALLKTLYMPYTKAGKLPQAEYKDLSIKKTAPTNIVFTDKSTDGTEKFTLTSREKDGSVKFSMHMKGKKEFDPIILGRALYKIGLGMVAFHQGKEAACNSRYDRARAFIRGEQEFPNNLLIKNDVKPHPGMGSHWDIRWGGTCFRIDIYGVLFLFNLEETPVLNATEEQLAQADFSLHPLYSL